MVAYQKTDVQRGAKAMGCNNERSAPFCHHLVIFTCNRLEYKGTTMAQHTHIHAWDVQPSEAKQLQERLRERIRLQPLATPVRTIAGADISFNKYSPTLYAGIVVLSLPELHVIEEVCIVAQTHFPYVPGLLSFREIPPLLQAWEQLQTTPDVLMLDGHGIAHPRRFGLACHMGLLTNTPAFGCAKSILVGTHGELLAQRGSCTPLVDKGETVGMVVRSKDRVRPLYVSPGHGIDMETSVSLTLACHGGYRQPEPTRHAHNAVNALRRAQRAATA